MPRDDRNRGRRNSRAERQAHKRVETPRTSTQETQNETPKVKKRQPQKPKVQTQPVQQTRTVSNQRASQSRGQRQTHKQFSATRTPSVSRAERQVPVRTRNNESRNRNQRQAHKVYGSSRTEEGREARRVLRNVGESAKRGLSEAYEGWKETAKELPELAGVAGKDDASLKVQAMRMGKNPNDRKTIDRLRAIRTEESEQRKAERNEVIAKQQKERKAFEEKTKNASGFEKALYGAAESGAGMAADIGVGAALGALTGGSASLLSLGAMGARTYGNTRGQAEQEGATESEDRRNAILQAAKEVGTESIFRGVGLAKGFASKSALSFGDRVANALTSKMTGKAADVVGAGARLGSGVAEENIEEILGWAADPVISEVAYKGNVRKRKKEQVQAQLKDESDALRAQVQDEQSARAMAAYLSSEDFINQNAKAYQETGMSEKKSLKMAEQMRDYLTASLVGDTESMEKLEEEMSASIAGKGLSKKSWSLSELGETVASTTMLTATTGLPGTVQSAYQGATLKEQLGDKGIEALAKTAVNFDDAEASEKAQVMADRIAQGKGITDTQAFDLGQAMIRQNEKDAQRVDASRNSAYRTIESENLVSPFMEMEDGSLELGRATAQTMGANIKTAEAAIKAINHEAEGDVKLSVSQVREGADAIASFQSGIMTIDDINALTYTNKTVRTAFEEVTGIDLGQYEVKKKNGEIDIAATNAKTKDALFVLASENLVETARAETVEWKDNTKGQIVTDISARMGSGGTLALQTALDDVDERDRRSYMLTANATDLVYQSARNMGTEWDMVKDNVTKMFPEIDESKLRMVYEAGLSDRSAAEDTARGRAVEIGKSLSETGEQETATGQVFVETKEPPKGTVIRLFSELANNLGADIHLVEHLGTAAGEANGAYDPNTNTFYINVNNAPETNLGYIFMHEVTHYLRIHAPEEYLALENLVREKWFQADSGAMQNAIAKKIAQYSSEQTLTEDQALEEIIADSAHEFLNDPNFAKQVAEENPTLAKAMVDAIKRVLRILRRMFWVDGIDDTQMDSLFSQLDIMTEAEALWLDAYKTAVRNRGNAAIDEMQDRMVRESISDSENESFVTLSPQRIDSLIEEYAIPGNADSDYSKAWIATINPRDFLKLTVKDETLDTWEVGTTNEFGQEVRDLDREDLQNTRLMPFLKIDTSESHSVIGHEGRHRMLALYRAGYTEVPVVIQDINEATKNNKIPMEDMDGEGADLWSQDFGDGAVNGDVSIEVYDTIPINEKNRSEIERLYGSTNEDQVRFSVGEIESELKENFDEYKEDKENLKIAAEALSDLQDVRYSVEENTSSVSGRWSRGEQVRTIGKGITGDLVNKGYVEFRGRKVKGPEDLAKLCQVLRDPRFETFRVVLTKGDKIVSLRSISSRLPGFALAFESENISDGVDIVRDRMKRTGADGYYLIHNHPSGNVAASFADLSVTRAYLALLGQDTYKGHIILDHDKYGFIDADVPQVIRGEYFPTAREELITGQQTFDLIHEPEIDHPLLGEEIHGHADIAKCGQFINASDDVSVLLYTNSPGEVTGIQEISNKTLKNNKEIAGFIRNQGVEFGAASAFLYTTDIETYQASKDLVKSGHLVDSVVAYGNNRQWSESAREVVSPRAGVEVLGQVHDDVIKRTHVFESATGVTEYRYSLPETDNDGKALTRPDIRYSVSAETVESLNNNGVDITESGTAVRYSYTSWMNDDQQAIADSLVEAGFDRDEVERWIDNVNGVASVIAGDRARLDYVADMFQDFLKSNDEYYFTLDGSTLCKKRRLYQGTYNAVMHRIKNSVLLADDVIRLRRMLDDAGYEVPCGICYEESRKKHEGKFANTWLNGETDKEYKARVKAYNNNLKKYPQKLENYEKKLAEYEKLKSEGKKAKKPQPPKEPQEPVRWMGYANMSHDDPFIPTLADVTTTDGRARLREDGHTEALEAYLEYQKGRGSANPKVSFTHTDYRGEIRNLTANDIKNLIHIGGLRIQSFSDFESPQLIDMMQAVLDMSAKHLTSQAYTKVPDFAWAFGDTGIKINLSLIGHVDENGVLQFDAKEGIDPKEAFKLRDKYSKNVGTIIVGANAESILAAWADPRIDMVIPFHRSGWSKEEFEKLGLGDYEDFQDYQSERILDGSKNGKSLKDAKMEALYSADYWDFSKSGKENAEEYLRLCAEQKRRPVFYNFLHDNGDGSWSLKEDGSTDGYWKSLIDFKMYDNDGVGSPQTEVKPNFNMEEVNRILSEYEGGADTLPVAEDVVDKFVDELVGSKRYSLTEVEQRDRDYMAAVESGDMEEAQRLVDEAAKEAGYGTEGYHGTNETFTVFGKGRSRGGVSRIKSGNWFVDNEKNAKTYAPFGKVMRTYLKLGNNYEVDANGLSHEKVMALNAVGTDYIAYSAARKGYDSVTFKRIKDKTMWGGQDTEDTVYTVFDSTNIKSADPVTYDEDGSVIPLSERFNPNNPDIRYSMPTKDSEGNTLTDGQMEFFKDSQARDRDGKLVVVYHTTNSGGFTVFDPSHSDDKRSIFFASNFKVSQTYGDDDAYNAINTDYGEPQHGYYMCYLNLKNPLIVNGKHSEWNEIPYGENEDGTEPAYTTHVFLDSEWDDDGNRTAFNLYGSFTDLSTGETHKVEHLTFTFPSEVYDSEDEGAIMELEDEARNAITNRLLESGMPDGLADSLWWTDEDPMDGRIAMVGSYDENGDYIDDMNRVSTRDLAEIAESEGHDGVIIRDVYDFVGTMDFDDALSDIYIAFSGEQIKDIRNENPTDDPDIRFSIPPEDNIMEWVASQSDMDDIPLEDEVAEEGRVRMAKSKEDFMNSVRAKWNPSWTTDGKVIDLGAVEGNIRQLVMGVMMNSDTDRKYKASTLDKVLVDVKSAYYLMKDGKAMEAEKLLWDTAYDMIHDLDFVDDSTFKQYKGLRDYLRTTPIRVGEEYWQDVDYRDFRKRNFGRIKLVKGDTNVDSVYLELQELYPEFFNENEAEQMSVPDQLLHIERVLDSIQPYRYAYTSEEAVGLAYDIASELWSIIYDGKEYSSLADRYKNKFDAQTKALKARHQEAMRKVREQRDAEVQAEKAKFKEYKEKQKVKREHKKKFDRIVKNYNELCRWVLEPTKEKNVPEEFRKVIAEFLQTLDLQTENSKKLEEKTGHAASKTLRMRELKDKLKAFAEGKTESDGSYVPGGFELDAYASYILDMLSDEYDGKPVDSLDATAIGHVDTLLRTIMHNVKRYRQIKTETRTIPLQDIGRRSVEFLKAKINRDGVYGKRRGALGALETINTSALTPAYLFDRLGPLKEMYDALRHNGFDKYIRNERMIIDKLNEILGKYNKVDRKGRNKPGSEIEKWRNDSEAVTVDLTNGQSVTMSVAQVMSLYCLAKRGEQALGHMMVGGIVVTPIQTGSKIEASKEKLGIKKQNGTSEKYVLAYEDIQNIISKLSSDQKSVADQLQKFMSEDMAKLGNEAHRELYGYDMFNEKNYFPIKVHGNERPTDINTIGDVIEKIKSFGFTKPLTPKAGQAIEIDDIFSVVADHCNGMNLYNAYLVPITDFMKVFNYSHLFENGESLTMKEAIAQAYGSDILKYIMNLIKDVNGIKGENRGGLEGLMNRALGTAKRTAVFGNIRVALQQPTAILRAAAEISPKYLMKALNPKNVKGLMPGATTADMEEMWKYCPISQWKAWGYYDTYMGRDIEDVMMNNWSIGDTMLAGYYGQLDNLTWSMIWQAVKAEQADLHPKMDTKSEEFLNMCGRRASEIFDKTQVVDSTFHRSDAMRSPQVATKVFTAFMAEPTLTLNVFRAGLFHASELFKSGDKAKAIGVLNKTFSVIIAQAILVAAAQAVADAWREKDPGLPWDDDDDDDKEKAGYFERFLHNFVYNVFDQLHLENNMYLVKDVTPYLNYMISQGADYMGWNPTLRAVMGWDQDYLYSQNNLVFAGLENTANGVAQFFKKLSKGDDYKDYNTGEPKKWYDIIQKIASGVGTFTGIPLGTLMRDAKPIIKKLIPEVYAADLDFMNSIFSKGDSDGTKGGDSDGSGMSDKDINAKVDAYRDGLSDEFDDDQKKKLTKQYEKSLRASTGTTEEKPEEDFDYQMELRSLKATEKATGKTGVEKDEVLWDVISDGYSKYIEDGDMKSIQAMKDVYMTHGGNEAYFDNKVVTKMQSIYKKTIFSETESDDENLQKQDMMRRYMLDHGVTAEELSEMCYKTYTARDLKAALRMGNEQYIMDELIPLVRAGLSRDDFEKLVKYQNYGAKTYDGKYSDPKYRKSTGNLVWPTQGQITSEFGYRNAPTAGASSNHPAIDIGASQGSPVVAADGGKVISAGNAGGYGNQVAIQHDNGMVTYYSHLYSWNVKVGDTVAQGQQVGQVGSTGISTGPHLDFKVEVNGEPVNPLEYLSR